MSDWLDLKQAAERLKTSERAVKYLVAQRKVQSRLVPQTGTKPKRFVHLPDIERIEQERCAITPVVMSDTSVERASITSDLVSGGVSAGVRFTGLTIVLQEDQWVRLEKLLNAPRPSMDVLTPGEAAVYSKRSAGALAKLRKAGKLANIGTPGRVLYSKLELDKLAAIGQNRENPVSDCVDVSD